MSLVLKGNGFASERFTDSEPWYILEADRLIVDAEGDAMIAIARKHPRLRFVMQDLPSTVEQHFRLEKDVQ